LVAVSQEEANVTKVKKDEARWNQLIQLLHYRNALPFDKLRTLDLDKLEEIWAKGEGSQPARAKAATMKTKAKTKEKPKAPVKTPKKRVNSALPMEDSVRTCSFSNIHLLTSL
jgi:hypothetical protein